MVWKATIGTWERAHIFRSWQDKAIVKIECDYCNEGVFIPDWEHGTIGLTKDRVSRLLNEKPNYLISIIEECIVCERCDGLGYYEVPIFFNCGGCTRPFIEPQLGNNLHKGCSDGMDSTNEKTRWEVS